MLNFIKKLFGLPIKKNCNDCHKNYFICPSCGCVFATAHEAAVCKDWDKVLGRHDNHTQHLHNKY